MILVVDDEPLARQIAAAVLSNDGYEVREAVSADEAFKTLSLQPEAFRLLLTDVQMPGQTGIELAKLLVERKIVIPTVFMSGSRPELPKDELQKIGCAFLSKPFRPNELLDVVRLCLEQEPVRK
ncbi:MAG: response regulator [Fimbriimonadales bacterium]